MRRKIFVGIIVFSFLLLGVSIVRYVQARTTPASSDPDVNIRLRGWNPGSFSGGLIDHPQNTDTNQPRLSTSFEPNFSAFFQVKDRNGQGLDQSNVSSPGMATISASSGSVIKAPVTGYSLGGGYNYVILYASSSDIVIHNTLDDSVASGYTVHFLNINVNPTLLQKYNENEAAGRKQLVEIPCQYPLGTVAGDPLVSIRDTGSFMDIRFKDWWTSMAGNCQNLEPGNAQPTQPFDLSQEVPCSARQVFTPGKLFGSDPSVTDPEFHSLRPYPASPCYKPVKDTTLLCGNDLIVVKETSPGDGGVCTPHTDGQAYTCTYKDVPQESSVSISLDTSQLPIMGNTEDVPNGTWVSLNTKANNLNAAQRVNNYVSWYLNGVINRAEEDFSSWDTDNLINYSGPINKLLPWALQTINRIASIDNADKTMNEFPAQTATDVNARHNQITGCPISGVGFVPCYLFTAGGISNLVKQFNLQISIFPSDLEGLFGVKNLGSILEIKNDNRLADSVGHKPPLETGGGFSNFSDYWRDYLNWQGKICIPLPIQVPFLNTNFYFCLNPGSDSTWHMLFAHIPYSTTEDRKGQIGTDYDSKPTNSAFGPQTAANAACKVSGAPCSTTCDNGKTFSDSCPQTFNSCQQWANEACGTTNSTPQVEHLKNSIQDDPGVKNVTFTPTSSDNHSLYFAHMQESAQLAALLQNTFIPSGQAGYSGKNDDNQQFYNVAKYQHCVIQDTRTNPGDSLHGDLNRTDVNGNVDQQIAGKLNFTATYTCTFTPTAVTTTNTTTSGTIVQINGYTYKATCAPVHANMAIYTRTPLAQENWEREVAGNMSIFKRIYPQVGPNTPVTEIKETPAETTATYSSTSGDTILAGKYSTGTPGDQAKIYFPYIGGIADYFLTGIQTALRPQGFSSGGISGQNGSSNNPPIADALQCTPDIATKMQSTFGDQASTAFCVANRESHCAPVNINKSCLNVGGTWDYSIGLFQINLLANIRELYDVGCGTHQIFSSMGIPGSDGRMTSACVVGNQALLDACIAKFEDPAFNIAFAKKWYDDEVKQYGTKYGWSPWNAGNGSCNIN